MSGSRLNSFRGALKTTLKTAMPELRSVEVQLGALDLDKINASSISAPSIRLGLLQLKAEPRANGAHDLDIEVAAFILTQGREDKRDEEAFVIAEALCVLLEPDQRFGLNGLSGPSEIKLIPIASVSHERSNVSLISVTWKQKLLRLGKDLFDNEGVLLSEYYANDELIVEVVENGGAP